MSVAHSVLIENLAACLLQRQAYVVTAESCTGGLIAAACTDIAGSSRWFERGYVSYSNDAKIEALGVDPLLIQTYGAVSQPVAVAMATGAIAHSHAHWSVAVTGIAGPDGGSADKPVGTVWLAWAQRDGQVQAEQRLFSGSRSMIRQATVSAALVGLIYRIKQTA